MNDIQGFKLALIGSSSAFALLFGTAAAHADAASAQLVAPAPEQVAQAAAAPEAAAGPGQLEEVVVTAQKRSENLQDVPIAVATISPAAVANFGALKTDDLAVAVPGLQIQHEINSATAFIRGIGPNSNGSGEESSVAVYLDDLYIESGDASIFALNAISSIQVLKGPQGTIFGRNATGGVIQVQTQDPSFTPSLDAHIGYGNYDTKAGDAYITGPIIPNVLAFNAAIIENDESKGWGRDVITGARAFTSNDWAARVKFLFTPTDSTKILLSMNYLYTRGEVGLGFNQVPQYIASGAPLLATGAGFVGWYNTQDGPVNDVSVDKNTVIELRAEQMTPWAKFVNILGWQRYSGYAQFAQDGSPADLVNTRLYQGGREFTEEFQVLNPPDASYASWLTWIAGAYYLHDNAGYPEAQLRGAAFGFPTGAVPYDFYLTLNDNVNTASVAGFGQADFKILPNLDLTAGYRYTRDERIFSGGLYVSPALGGGPAGAITTPETPGADKTYNLNTYRAALDYHFTDDLSAYFAFNRGVKSGQFDTFGTGFGGPTNNPAVAPEVLYSYEVGVKSEFLDHHVRVNLDAFHYDASNLQFAVIIAGGTKLVNAAGAVVDGGEADATVKLIDNLTLSGSLSVQKGHYTSFPAAPAYFNPPGFTENAAGHPTVHTPDFSGNINVDYTIPTDFGDFDANVNYTHTASFQFFPDESLQQPETNIVNASLLWTAPSGEYDLRGWGANLTGEQYYSFGSESIGLGKQFSPAAPRTYGITLGVHFSIPEAPEAAAPPPPPPPAPAPAPAPEPEKQREFQVFFDFDKSNITDAAARVIQAAADVVKAGGIAHITVTGHTDTVGTARYNQGLSERRAASVKTQLASDGVDGGEISTVGVGKSGLLVPTKDGVREPQNRRAVIELQ